ncbi:homoserine dehydrogenase [Listeria booriae]|uniref:Homoserine dehydrogenase n=1 Tax=Listeria booriae TaxID=1552123 RepID=A0A7X1D2H2_9LIST|nr:homoserine dehydrogenase [Listeria booriae]MBC1292115.1 homoserine dehydrogenase [Listeria booriae]MBC1511467.1 homoserine dehydrogenase [Listeria booriae]MBC1559592.1 homoserine dehydrogenase [Listeria booriae]MBC1566389.1 homoserine dehydrogenase [Listeria booriae]MBC1792337.1 homoserine dehydrogenase [Listeria booriae]
MEAKLKVGILGFGTVGSGVIHILEEHAEKISQITGYQVSVKKVLVRDLEKNRRYETKGFSLTTEPTDILDDPEISVVVEVMGSIEPAREYILQALKAGKHVVTANKDLIALHGDELIAVAQANKCDLFYEASVAGGIPILRTIVNGLAADKIQKVMGIVNGTTNFMLTKMKTEKRTYEDVLKEAQDLGFAEADPTSDVDGIDAARKMVILTRLAFGMNVDLADVDTVGIRGIAPRDMEVAEQLKYVIKLVGTAEEKNGSVAVSVGPVLLPKYHPMAGVNNENNAVFVTGAAAGETMYYGPGAGELPTATSVVSDIITVAKNSKLGTNGNAFNSYQHDTKQTSPDDIFSKYYMRIVMDDKTGTFLKLTQIFAEAGVGFDKILQEPLDDYTATVVVVTHVTSKAQLEQAISRVELEPQMQMQAKYQVVEG